MDRLIASQTPLKNLYVIDREPIHDKRGFLERMFCNSELEHFLNGNVIRQINHTLTKGKGVVRGMHFQYAPYCEQKIVSCLRGTVYDVVIDLRKNSPTFLDHYGLILSEENFRSLCIPEGFAHGFQCLSSQCEMLYYHTADYHAASEGGINALDPTIDITWPINITGRSLKDNAHKYLENTFSGLETNVLS